MSNNESIEYGAEVMETAFEKGQEQMKETLEKGQEQVRKTLEQANSNMEKFASFQRETMDAMMEAATLAGKGVEKMQSEVTSYIQRASEGYVDASRAFFGAKSMQSAMEAQSTFVKSAMEDYVSQMTKMTELMTDTARTAFEPLQGRAQAFMGLVNKAA